MHKLCIRGLIKELDVKCVTLGAGYCIILEINDFKETEYQM